MQRGRPLRTLGDVGAYAAALPASEQRLAHWQAAAQLLLVAESGGDPMIARIAMLQALNHGNRAPPEIRRKRARIYKVHLVRKEK